MKPLALAFAMFSIVPVPKGVAPDANSRNSALALRWLPLVGAALGAVAALAAMVFWRGHDGGSAFLGAVVAISVLVVLTRGLHLDGLADIADGLGSRRPAAEALEIMRRSDIGPFGVGAAVLVVLLQVAALTATLAVVGRWQGLVVLVAAAASGRLAALVAARPDIPPARPTGFGALVAGSADWPVQAGALFATIAAAGLLSAAAGFDATGIVWSVAAVVIGQVVAATFCWHVVRRIGGITGDAFGALVEIATASTLLVFAGVVSWHGSL